MLLDQRSLSKGYRHRAVMCSSLLFWANMEDVKPAAQFGVPQKRLLILIANAVTQQSGCLGGGVWHRDSSF